MSKAGLIGKTISVLLLATAVNFVAADDLYTISKALTKFYEKPGLDISVYDTVMIDSLGVDDARVIPPPWVEGKDRSPKKWELNAKDIQWLKDNYRAAMKEQIESQGRYAVVSEPGPDAVILDVKIVSLTPWARSGEKVTTKGSGELTMQAELRDSMTGELLAVYEGEQDVGTEYQQNTRLGNEHNVRTLFEAWGEKVRLMMDESRK